LGDKIPQSECVREYENAAVIPNSAKAGLLACFSLVIASKPGCDLTHAVAHLLAQVMTLYFEKSHLCNFFSF